MRNLNVNPVHEKAAWPPSVAPSEIWQLADAPRIETMATRSSRLAALAIAALLTGCACSAAGCANQLRFRIGADLIPRTAYEVMLCLDDEPCQTATLIAPDGSTGASAGDLWLWTHDDTVVLELGDGPFTSSHQVRFSVLDEGGEAIARLDGPIELVETRPNGAFCEPTCWSADYGLKPLDRP